MYYATMLFAAEPRYFFMNGWGQRLMEACYNSVDKDWLPVMHWPLSFLSTGPTYSLFANMSQLSTSYGQLQGLRGSPYAQQPLQTVPLRQHTEPSTRWPDRNPRATPDTSLSTHPTGYASSSYAPRVRNASFLHQTPETKQQNNQTTHCDEHTATSCTHGQSTETTC